MNFLFLTKVIYIPTYGYGHEYKSKYGGDIEDLISRFVFKDGEITKGSLDLKILNDFPKLKNLLNKTQTHCYIFQICSQN